MSFYTEPQSLCQHKKMMMPGQDLSKIQVIVIVVISVCKILF